MSEQPITNVEDAVREHGALPMRAGPKPLPFPPQPRNEEERLRMEVVQLQDTLAEAVKDASRARRERDLIRERVSEPYGCRHCGERKRSHGRQWMVTVGVHSWEHPSDEQVKARMLARRAARFTSHAERLAGLLVARTEELLTSEARVAELEAERHVTNEVLDDAVKALRADRDRIAELEAAKERAAAHTGHLAKLLVARTEDLMAVEADGITQRIAPSQAVGEDEDPGRCLEVHAFSPRDGWRLICGSCDHGKDAECHRVGGA